MHKLLSVAIREFVATVTTKGFIFGVLVFPLIIGLLMPVIIYLVQRATPTITGEVAVVDQTGLLEDLDGHLARNSRSAKMKDVAEEISDELGDQLPVDQATIESALQQQTVDDTLYITQLPDTVDVEEEKKRLYDAGADSPRQALVIVPPEAVFGEARTDEDGEPIESGAKSYKSFELFAAPKLDLEIRGQIQGAISGAIVDARIAADERANDSGLSPGYLRALLGGARAEVKTVTEEGERDSLDVAAMFIPIAFMMLVWISVFTAGQYLLYSTIEEKSSRVMEVLLSAVSPMQLLVGKIIGQLFVGLVILVIYGALGIGALVAFAAMDLIEVMDLVLLMIYFAIAFVSIACMMAAVGSAVTDVKEAGALMGPIMLVVMIPMFLWMPISRAPNSLFAVILSFIPPIGPFVMVVRISGAEEIPWWQIPASIVVGALGTAAFAWAASKIFRIGMLMYGKPPDLRTLIKWLRMV